MAIEKNKEVLTIFNHVDALKKMAGIKLNFVDKEMAPAMTAKMKGTDPIFLKNYCRYCELYHSFIFVCSNLCSDSKLP